MERVLQDQKLLLLFPKRSAFFLCLCAADQFVDGANDTVLVGFAEDRQYLTKPRSQDRANSKRVCIDAPALNMEMRRERVIDWRRGPSASERDYKSGGCLLEPGGLYLDKEQNILSVAWIPVDAELGHGA
jgi:hypothetical protein